MSASFDASRTVAAYSSAFRHLQTLPGFSLQQLLRAEAAVILKTWAGRVKVAKASEIDDRARYSALKHLGATQAPLPGDVSINVGSRGPSGFVWIRTRGAMSGNRWGRTTKARPFSLVGRMSPDGRFVAQWRHYRDADWRNVMDTVIDAEIAINKETRKARVSVGLARQSVVQIADDLGIELENVSGGGNLSAAGIAKARAALTRSGKSVKNGTGKEGGQDTKWFVELMDTLPYGSQIGMPKILSGVLAGRAKFLVMAFEKGAGDSIANARRSFPQVFKTAGFS